MSDYLDDIEFIRNISQENFWPKMNKELLFNYDDLSKSLTSYWSSTYAITKCYDDVCRDPADILEEEINKYQIESTFGTQDINKKTYDIAAQALTLIRNKLLQRRKEINE